MSYTSPTGSPPPAHPAALPSSSSTSFPPLASSSSNWGSTGSFYLGGSAAPAILNTRRAPPLKGRTSSRQTTSPASPSPSTPPSPPVLLTDGRCCCCDTEVRYPRASPSFRCTVCETINDLNEEQRRGKTKEGVQPAEATPVTEEQLLALSARLRAREVETDEQLARRLAGLGVAAPSPSSSTITALDEDDPEDLLVAYLLSAFNNLPSLEASFRPSQPERAPSSSARPRAGGNGGAEGAGGSDVEETGTDIAETDGGWVVALFEAPVLLADYTPDAAQRRALLSSFIGLLSNLPNSLHHRLVLYLTSPSYPRHLLLEKAELVCSFLSWRIGEAANPAPGTAGVDYRTDWRVRAGARVASLLLNASHPSALLPLSSFYVTLVDSLGESAIVQDFVSWENREGAFELCQYPFLMSLGVKMGLLGWDGERQMMERAREAYRSTFSGEQLQSPLLVLRVRREHLVSDSLRQISNERLNLKKTLRIAFEGEEGIDAGGLRKEWFLLLCRQLFDPQFGMFLHDEESNLCWFNPASFETDDFWLVGVVIGLALYNQATLDVPLPLATYKRLLSEPTTLADLAQLHPSLARGLQQLLDFPDADSVEETFCRSFVGEYEAWGEVVGIELVEGGKEIAVTGENRQEYVRLLTKFYLDTSISTQFDAFAEGFHEVCAGNALSLFKAEELELVVRGSEEPLEVEQLRLATVYEGFAAGDETVEVFWTVFGSLSATRQRSLLYFITASDRIPATGTSALQLKLQCLGPDSDRLPQSHTCFNTLSLYRYSTQEKMERMLMRAMEESEGFGLR
ncbi:hypothetical protein JCM10213_006945 [Rhodosporidiobolus nylandii]